MNERNERIQAHYFFLDMVAQEVRSEVSERGEQVWAKAGIEAAALVGHVEKYYPSEVILGTLVRGSISDLVRQMCCYGFLLGQRWEQQRDKEGDQ